MLIDWTAWRRLLAVAVVLSAGPLSVAAQSQPGCKEAEWKKLAHEELTPQVHAAYTATGRKSEPGELCVLVLWRGETGWHAHRDQVFKALVERGFRWDQVRVHSSDSEPSLNEGFRTFSEDLGDIYLAFDYEWGSHRLQIQRQTLELGSNNVVLVDHIDGVGGEPAISLTRIDLALPIDEDEFWQLVKRSHSVRALLGDRAAEW